MSQDKKKGAAHVGVAQIYENNTDMPENEKEEFLIDSIKNRSEFGHVQKSNELTIKFAQIGMNKLDYVLSPEEIGWSDPEIDPQLAL